MGLFSKCCAKSFLPVVHSGRGYPELCEVVALPKFGGSVTGMYDGYGRVGSIDVCGTDGKDWNDVKFVLKSKYSGERYEDLPKSIYEKGQGHFMDDKFLDYCMEKGTLKSARGYHAAFKRLANW